MISYYKYTEGEAFTLNGIDYVGFFNVIDGKAYTGKKKTTSSGELIQKQTFISEIYLKKLEFDSNYDNNINLLTISQEKFDIFTKTNLEKVIDVINLNNLNIYKSLVLQNPNFLNVSNNNAFFYGLSSTFSDIRNDDNSDDGINLKNIYTQIDPFEFDGYWGFLDNITSGAFTVNNDDEFTYFCTDNINTYTVKGSFTDPSVKLTFDANSTDDITKTIVIDDIDLNIFQIKEKSIILYEYEPYISCGTLLKKDEIFLQENLLFVRIGNSIRLEITNNDFYIKNKYSNDIYYKIDINSLNLGIILNCQIRSVDDLIAIVSKNNNKFYITYIDPEFPNQIINQFEMLNFEDLTFNLLFSDIDSNIIILTFKEYVQTRFISNSKYPASTSNSNTNYSKVNFKYLKNYIWQQNTLLYNLSNNIKWNSNSLKSNSYNNIIIDIKTVGNMNYSIIHNIGRLYVIKKDATEDFKIFKIPKNLPKSFNAIECSNSSFGLYLNNSLKNIVTDIINIFTNNECKIKLSEDGSDIIISELENIKISIENMFFNGNEQLNVLTLNRIFETIVEIQRKLIN